MYANMKPRQAAAALTTVDEEVAVKILTGMKSKQSGEILSYMDPRHAARLSEVLAKMQMRPLVTPGTAPHLLPQPAPVFPAFREEKTGAARVDTRQKEQNLNTTKL